MGLERAYKPNPTDPKWAPISKTVILNVLIGVIGGISVVVNEGTLDEDTAKVLVLFGAIGNLILRFMTKKPITLRRPKK